MFFRVRDLMNKMKGMLVVKLKKKKVEVHKQKGKSYFST
ncbi:MAG: hypothetical protein ACJAUR_002131 [Ulvibacter sp.]|jgi:hypothetical protein